MAGHNLLYAQSGGVTAVINATAGAVIETARRHRHQIPRIYAGRDGIIGVLTEDLIDTDQEPAEAIAALRHTPGGAFGSCRYKLKGINEDRAQYERLIDVFRAHNIGYFLYNGGGDSQDTAYKVSQIADKLGYPITCIGVPKTVDNDLPFTDNCPGFGSVAKYIATSTQEASLDIASMATTSTKVFILEVMGRHAGWIAAASGLARQQPRDGPHIILFPELTFNADAFLDRVRDSVDRHGHCVVVASEGIRTAAGEFVADSGGQDAFGHTQLGGVAPTLAAMVKDRLGLKYHWAVADYLQRSARHLASQTDLDQAYALGEAAVGLALRGANARMPYINRDADSPYQWHVEDVGLAEVANQERQLPRDFISENGFAITEACRRYLQPLIQGEAFPPFKDGLPDYVHLINAPVPKQLNKPFELKT